MAKNDNKNFSLPTIKDLEIYFDLIKKKDISELEIETDQIRIKIVSENKNIKFSTQQTASEIINHSQSAELNNQNNKDTFEVNEGDTLTVLNSNPKLIVNNDYDPDNLVSDFTAVLNIPPIYGDLKLLGIRGAFQYIHECNDETCKKSDIRQKNSLLHKASLIGIMNITINNLEEEFKESNELDKIKVNQTIECFLERVESAKGELIVSYSKAKRMKG